MGINRRTVVRRLRLTTARNQRSTRGFCELALILRTAFHARFIEAFEAVASRQSSSSFETQRGHG